MARVTADISVSADGFSTGPNQREDAPFGDGVGEILHEWMFEHGADHREETAAILEAGAYVMGRNMFGPIRGLWTGDWQGWWGPEPPYHAPVFVLTHFPREPVVMAGGTTFHFVTDGIESAVSRAKEAAGDRDVSIAGGAETLNQVLSRRLLDVLRLHVVPLTLGLGGRTDVVRLFDGVPPLRFDPAHVRSTPHVTHITYEIR
ncbi:dihydrofolate reductase family protein [Microbacterium sulfonylureivorans]|uniref:dihydrofolate reductase family protein n=1 Tax=Microbacterium sulfonylureivorans TaxID=2486854 RepID=UPI000FDAE6FC|nr:dihydrofolate reductase family protein [Microbacterium sulfonylureivorans]